MAEYDVILAFNVSCYMADCIEADSEDEALQQIKNDPELWSNWEVDYSTAENHRIVILSEDREVIKEDTFIRDLLPG